MVIAPGMVIYVTCAYQLQYSMMKQWIFGNNAQLSNAEIGKNNNWEDTIKLKASALQHSHKANKIFTLFLLNNIIPHWYGTKQDFCAYTETPKQGVIACGILVSTTLKDMGLNVNRYKLAQQSPTNEAKTIAIHPDAVQQLSFI